MHACSMHACNMHTCTQVAESAGVPPERWADFLRAELPFDDEDELFSEAGMSEAGSEAGGSTPEVASIIGGSHWPNEHRASTSSVELQTTSSLVTPSGRPHSPWSPPPISVELR